MTETLPILGQAIGTGADAILYTVPASTSIVASTIIFCNQSATRQVFRLAIVKSGDSLAAKHYIAYDTGVNGNESYPYTLGLTLGTGDSIHFTAPSTVSISAFGAVIT